jgi:coenzyme F420 hydrogenase subunit beta
MCYWNCPMAVFDVDEIEMEIYGRTRTDDEASLGVSQAICAIRAKDSKILSVAQDGGAVSAVLSLFFDDGGDGAIVAGIDEEHPWKAKPLVARSKEEMLEGAGTKYTPSPTLVGVASAIHEYDLKNLAVVGTPCQMRALSKIQTGVRSEARIKEALRLKIGLFCMETFTYPSFMEYLNMNEIDPEKVDKFEIKSGRFIASQNGDTLHRVRLSKVKSLVRGCCHNCGDFSSEFADLSVGNVGSPNGWSTVVVRTKEGEKVLKAAEKEGLIEVADVVEGKGGLDLVYRLSNMKRKNAEKDQEEVAKST